jgi:hypothetical protein
MLHLVQLDRCYSPEILAVMGAVNSVSKMPGAPIP